MVRIVITFPHELCLKKVCSFWVYLFLPIQQRVDWLQWFPLLPVPVRLALARFRYLRLLFAMVRVSVQRSVPPVTPTTSPVMAVAPAAALARSEAIGVINRLSCGLA